MNFGKPFLTMTLGSIKPPAVVSGFKEDHNKKNDSQNPMRILFVAMPESIRTARSA